MVSGTPRPAAFSPTTFPWVSRLGEFLRTHVPGAVETRTTLTRQQAADVPPGEPDPPLFGPGARRVMEGRLQRAPLLHGTQAVERPSTDPGSSNSIPREVVQEEVRRQVTEALGMHQRYMDELREENRRLRGEMDEMAKGFQTVPVLVSLTMVVEYQKGIIPVFVRVQKNLGGIGLAFSLWVMEYQSGIIPVFVRVQKNLGGIGLISSLWVMEYQKGIKLVFVRVQKNLGGIGLISSLWVMEYQKGIKLVFLRVRKNLGGIELIFSSLVLRYQEGIKLAEQNASARATVEPSSATPTPMDVLITGMSQLQQVLLKQRSEVIDLEPKAVSELVKLPEYTAETGAIDFQDYLYLAEQQIGCVAEYQTLSPVRRLSVTATLTPELKEDKYKKLERKVAALVLASLSKGVRDDLVAYRVQGVHQILCRLMLIFQPGGAQDRAQLLKQLDVTESPASPAEATAAIRRWYRLLQRAADLGVKLPDESLQVKSLSVIVRRTAEQNADFKFRLALARTELQIDTRPTQENVMRYLQHLLAELEQLGAVARKQGASSTGGTTTTSPSTATTPAPGGTALKGLQPTPESKAKPKASPNRKVCSWFSSDNGVHSRRFESYYVFPAPGPKVQAMQATAAPSGSGGTSTTAEAPADPAPATTSSTTTTAGGGPNKIDTVKVTEILNETNKMLKSIAAANSSATSAPAAPVDPLEMILKQLDEVRRLKVMRVREPCEATSSFASAVSWYETRLSSTTLARLDGPEEEEALLDSATHAHVFRPPSSAVELEDARRVRVALVMGEERSIPQNRGGTLLSEYGGEGTILPMGQLVRLLGCRVTWTPNKLTVVHPALDLIAELEQKRMASFEQTVQDLQKQIKTIRDNGLLHKNPVFSTVSAEVLLGVPEGVPRGDRDGWNLLKGTPWSRAKRKALYHSDGWVVHLFSGDERGEEAKRRDAVKKSFWSEALSGDEVMVDVDFTASRSMDLLQRDGIFKVLAWGALNGKVKAIIGGPPRHTFPTVVQGEPIGGQHLKETQLIVKMMLLFYMAQEGRTALWRAGGLRTMVKPHVGFLLEHPAGPGGGRLSFFDTPLWKAFAMDSLMGEVPCSVNEKEVILGGNMNLWHLREARLGPEGSRDQGSIWPLELVAHVACLGPEGSRDQGSIWPLELVAHVAFAVRAWVGLRNHEGFLSSLVNRSWLRDPEPLQLNKFNVRDWQLHVQHDHLPYRKDCRICIERASGKPHRKVSHPSAYCLSIDTAGPFRNVGAGGYKYLLVGCYRHPKLLGTTPEEEPAKGPSAAEVVPRPDDGEDWLGEDLEAAEEEVPLVAEEPEGGVGYVEPGPPDDDPGSDGEIEALKELAKPLEFVSVYVAKPMRSRKKAETLKAIQELYIQLRSAGFPLGRIHMDRAREYQSSAFEHWAAARDIELSRTQGDDPSQNGTAERAVGYVKMRMRVLLAQAKELSGADDEVIKGWWAMAAETAVSQHQALAMGRKFPSAARFGSRVLTRRKGYGAGGTDLKPKWIGGVYLGPARSVPGGHMVYTDEGNLWFTTNLRQFEERDPGADGASEPVTALLHQLGNTTALLGQVIGQRSASDSSVSGLTGKDMSRIMPRPEPFRAATREQEHSAWPSWLWSLEQYLNVLDPKFGEEIDQLKSNLHRQVNISPAATDIVSRSRQLFALLSVLVKGRGFLVIKSVSGNCGYEALRQLISLYAPQSKSRSLGILTALTQVSAFKSGEAMFPQILELERVFTEYESASQQLLQEELKTGSFCVVCSLLREIRKYKADLKAGKVQAVSEESGSTVSTVTPSQSASQVGAKGRVARLAEIDLTAFDECDEEFLDGDTRVCMIQCSMERVEHFSISDPSEVRCNAWDTICEYELFLSLPSDVLLKLCEAKQLECHADHSKSLADSFKCHADHSRSRADSFKCSADQSRSLADSVKCPVHQVSCDADQVTPLKPSMYVHGSVRALASVNGEDIIVDSGADISALPETYSQVGNPAPSSAQRFVDASGRLLQSKGIRIAEVRVGSIRFREKFLIGGVTCPLLSLGKLYKAGFYVIPSTSGDSDFILTNGDLSEPVRLKRQSLCATGSVRVLNALPSAVRAVSAALHGPLLRLDSSGWQRIGSRRYALLSFGQAYVDSTLIPLTELLWYRTTLVRRDGRWTVAELAADVSSLTDRTLPLGPPAVEQVITIAYDDASLSPESLGLSPSDSDDVPSSLQGAGSVEAPEVPMPDAADQGAGVGELEGDSDLPPSADQAAPVAPAADGGGEAAPSEREVIDSVTVNGVVIDRNSSLRVMRAALVSLGLGLRASVGSVWCAICVSPIFCVNIRSITT
ncbi:unnamed protein product [Symbiodinium sp. CCMP2592]|nr:unnamed protein product [Symbiodinium sp. CCMP2592]